MDRPKMLVRRVIFLTERFKLNFNNMHKGYSMKTILVTTYCLLAIFFGIGEAVAQADEKYQTKYVELTEADSAAFAKLKSMQISVYGIHLGMSRKDVEAILRKSTIMVGVENKTDKKYNRLYVYQKKADGSKSDCILCLVWDLSQKKLQQILIFHGFRNHLKDDLKRLLTLEVFDDNSEFKKKVFGRANRSSTTFDIPQIKSKHITYYYDDRGIEVVHKHSLDGEVVGLGFVKP